MALQTILGGIVALSFIGYECNQSKEKEINTIGDPKTSILTAHNWMVDETIQHLDGEITHFKREGINTTGYNQSALRLRFNADGTGVYIDHKKNSLSFNWRFLNSSQQNLKLELGIITYEWHMVEILKDYIYETTILPNGDLASARWTVAK